MAFVRGPYGSVACLGSHDVKYFIHRMARSRADLGTLPGPQHHLRMSRGRGGVAQERADRSTPERGR